MHLPLCERLKFNFLQFSNCIGAQRGHLQGIRRPMRGKKKEGVNDLLALKSDVEIKSRGTQASIQEL